MSVLTSNGYLVVSGGTVAIDPPLTMVAVQESTGIRCSGTVTGAPTSIAIYLSAAVGGTYHGVTTVAVAADGAWRANLIAPGGPGDYLVQARRGTDIVTVALTVSAVSVPPPPVNPPPSDGGTTTTPPPSVPSLVPPPPASAGTVAQFDVRNDGATDLPARVITVARPFAVGALAAGLVGAQVDNIAPLAADGSTRVAAITLAVPALAAGTSYRASLAAASHIPGLAVPTSAAPLTVDLNITAMGVDPANVNGVLALATPNVVHLDLSSNIAVSTDYWMRGPLATQVRVKVPVVNALSVIADVTFYSDSNVKCDVVFDNTTTFCPAGGPLTYSATVSYGGVVKYTMPSTTQWQYTVWAADPVWSGTAPSYNVAHPPADLIATGFFDEYDIAKAVPASPATTGAAFAPLAGGNFDKQQGDTGGRPDIGPSPQWIQPMVVAQTPEAYNYAKEMSRQYGGNPIYARDVNTGDWIKLTDRPTMQFDTTFPAGQHQPTKLQDGGITIRSGWQPDGNHAPNPHQGPALLTGDRWRFDLLTGQAAWSVSWMNPAAGYRNGAQGLICVPGTQVRGQAWNVRQLMVAAALSLSQGAYYAQLVDNNLSGLLADADAVATSQGETGYIVRGVYGTAGNFAPWQQDYFGHSMLIGERMGFAKCATILDRMRPFLASALCVGRFGDWKFNNRPAYNLTWAPLPNGPYTFSAIQVASGGAMANGDAQKPHNYNIATGEGWADGDIGGYLAATRGLMRAMARRNRHPDWLAARDNIEANWPPALNDAFMAGYAQFDYVR